MTEVARWSAPKSKYNAQNLISVMLGTYETKKLRKELPEHPQMIDTDYSRHEGLVVIGTSRSLHRSSPFVSRTYSVG